MKSSERKRLEYRRQYIIAPEPVECTFEHGTLPITGSYTLYYHTDLQVTVHEEGDARMILLGDLFDFEVPEKGNSDILQDLASAVYQPVLERIGRYTGRFVLVYINGQQFCLVTDTTATRKVYYCTRGEKVWMASQPHLLAGVLGIHITSNESKLNYYRSEDFRRLSNASIGNTTCYDEIYQLMPNHYLDVNPFSVQRFWPNEKIEIRPFEEIVRECAKMVKGYMEAIVSRFPVMLPITAGKDSRLLLAGARGVREKIYYYINRNSGVSDRHPDIRVPGRLFRRLGLDFHVLNLESEVDKEFRKVYLHNNPLASEEYLPHIYNYYKNFEDRVNLPGNLAAYPVGFKHIAKKNISPGALAEIYSLGNYNHAIQYFTGWLNGCEQRCKDCDVDIIKCFTGKKGSPTGAHRYKWRKILPRKISIP
jgi:hypothetical protein